MVMMHSSRRYPRARSLVRYSVSFALVCLSVGLPRLASASTPGSQLWAAIYSNTANDEDVASAVTTTPDGTEVFVTGYSAAVAGPFDYATAAYDASTGSEIWATRYNGPGNADDSAHAIVASPDGSKVFVTGDSTGSTTDSDYATIAYDTSTGTQLWARRYNGQNNRDDYASALGISPDGSRVFVTGFTRVATGGSSYEAIAYDASNGSKLWATAYVGPVNADDAQALKVSPDGSRVFVTGTSGGGASGWDYATVAYDASTGVQSWVKRLKGDGSGRDGPTAIGVSPDGSRVFVTGYVRVSGSWDYATVAYDTSSGSKLWEERYNDPANGDDYAYALGVSPDGSRVFVTGRSGGSKTSDDFATVTYRASTGAERWVKRYNGTGKGFDAASALGVSTDGSDVFVTGVSLGSSGANNYVTLAYDVATGSVSWAAIYNGSANNGDLPYALAVSPDGSKVIVTGVTYNSASHADWATVAYSTA
jgi:lipocalin